jgi:hypothetical protein
MSKVKFNKNDPKQVGSLGLHIMGINDMPADKWLSYFTSDEIKSYAMDDEQGFIGRLPPHLQDKARDLLSSVVEVTFNNMVDRTDALIAMSKSPTASASVALVGPVVKGTVVTDKGTYVSVEVLREKLTLVYKMDSFNGAFIKALDLTGLSVDIEYISEPAKKKLLSNLKVAMVSEIESIVDNV